MISTFGAWLRNCSAINSRSDPIRIAVFILDLQRSINSCISAPFANPPAIQTADNVASSEAAAACGLVALESSIQVIPSLTRTVSILWRPGLNF